MTYHFGRKCKIYVVLVFCVVVPNQDQVSRQGCRMSALFERLDHGVHRRTPAISSLFRLAFLGVHISVPTASNVAYQPGDEKKLAG